MPPGIRPRLGESGGAWLTLMVLCLLVIVGSALTMGIGSAVYDHYLLRDLANRVVKEYATLPLDEVKRRVRHEIDQSRLPGEALMVTKTLSGYRVEVAQTIPLSLVLGGTQLHVPGHGLWTWTYRTET
ncbi:MAG: hypothetical protein HQL97_03550 [Magnetococcales bacterium]|nr:hypothetical protein [Magnetococcales bacterium]